MRCYIGYDPREAEAYRVARDSLLRHASAPLDIIPIDRERLARSGLYHRHSYIENGFEHDEISGAPISTGFANARFMVPLLAQTGWALFLDCDVVLFADVAELFALADPRYALMCVKHDDMLTAQDAVKMEGQAQTAYRRKNWSSVMLINCDHPGMQRLTLAQVNGRPGRDLHSFCWLRDDEIGELPAGWNWLVNVEPMPDDLKLAHFTLGGPWLPGWHANENDALWIEAQKRAGS